MKYTLYRFCGLIFSVLGFIYIFLNTGPINPERGEVANQLYNIRSGGALTELAVRTALNDMAERHAKEHGYQVFAAAMMLIGTYFTRIGCLRMGDTKSQ